jgi:hypothetical protein
MGPPKFGALCGLHTRHRWSPGPVPMTRPRAFPCIHSWRRILVNFKWERSGRDRGRRQKSAGRARSVVWGALFRLGSTPRNNKKESTTVTDVYSHDGSRRLIWPQPCSFSSRNSLFLVEIADQQPVTPEQLSSFHSRSSNGALAWCGWTISLISSFVLVRPTRAKQKTRTQRGRHAATGENRIEGSRWWPHCSASKNPSDDEKADLQQHAAVDIFHIKLKSP